jgi:hypothetical protein
MLVKFSLTLKSKSYLRICKSAFGCHSICVDLVKKARDETGESSSAIMVPHNKPNTIKMIRVKFVFFNGSHTLLNFYKP